jgi:RNA polymerase sigma-70 factor (ECF subfamily)
VDVIGTADDRSASSADATRPEEVGDVATRRVLDLADRGLDRSFRLAGLILGDQTEAQDATQDALVRAWRAAATLRDPAGFDAWFDRILINVCRDRLRRRGKVRLVTLDGAAGTVVIEDPFRTIYAGDELLGAMRALGDDERMVLILHFWADLTLEAVGARLDCPVGTVKSRLHRGLKAMRRQLGHSSSPGGSDD